MYFNVVSFVMIFLGCNKGEGKSKNGPLVLAIGFGCIYILKISVKPVLTYSIHMSYRFTLCLAGKRGNIKTSGEVRIKIWRWG